MNADLPAFRTKLQTSYCNTAKCPDQKRRITGQSQDNVIRAQKIDLRLFTVSSTSLLSSLMAGLSPSHFSDSVLKVSLDQSPGWPSSQGTRLRALAGRGGREQPNFPLCLAGGLALPSAVLLAPGLDSPNLRTHENNRVCPVVSSDTSHSDTLPGNGLGSVAGL